MASQLAVDTTILAPFPACIAERAPRLQTFSAIRVSLMASLLAAPLAFGAVQAWAWAAMAVLAFLLFLFWSIAQVRQGSVTILWSPLYLPAGFFLLLAMIQFTARLTMDSMATREALVKLSADLILFFLVGQLFTVGPSGRRGAKAALATVRVLTRADAAPAPVARCRAQSAGPYSSGCDLAPLRWTLVVYTFLLALLAIFQFFSSPGFIYWRVASAGWIFGPYVNHNHYAGLMEMLIPLSIAGALPALRRHPSAVVLGCALLIPIASLWLSGSRGGSIAFLAEVLLTAVLVLRFGPRHARKVTALLGGGMLLAAGLLFFWMAPRHAAERLTKMGDGTHPPEVELGNRLMAARDALGILRDHPWLGAGLGSFETAFPRYMSFPSDFRWDHAHNDYAEALAETGLAGGAAIATALIMFFWLAFRNVRERLEGPGGWMQFAAAVGCCGLLVHSLADFNLHMPANAAWFAACAAIATGSCDRRGTEAGVASSAGPASAGAAWCIARAQTS